MMPLSDNALLRYDRQIALKDFDIDKQQQLAAANVMIVGMGGLGCVVATYLASSGIGQLTLVDPDTVSLSNLPRQILFTETDCGKAKVEVAQHQLALRNPECRISVVQQAVDESSEWQVRCAEQQIVIDCTDQLSSRQQINRHCFATSTPLISGAAIRMEGCVISFTWQKDEPCYECLSHFFGEPIGSCVENGVMAPLTGIIGSLQAMEAIRHLTQYGSTTQGRYLLYDAMNFSFTSLKVKRNPHCELCA
ncbi:molybdopterin-synthase adenylyltransferase MoeB [Rosenbergiella epipactidis]|uniref:molybdopterin-synthase adenylyltransferase MoeB n=1 Tax=Rosenbergiella epipactidis TaxID=1544694 RepID=UPI001BD9FDC0|nr:molybdopterin-synthase adenylyltransferase MoeB [Rosenbergiella epipactidis]MBT0718739.1 molybdopterin-synthase adenylyltransferase MoeB [Rosenbergiella epipactidis]